MPTRGRRFRTWVSANRWLAAAVIFGLVLLAAGSTLLATEPLGRANAWAGIAGMYLALVALIVQIVFGRNGRRRRQQGGQRGTGGSWPASRPSWAVRTARIGLALLTVTALGSAAAVWFAFRPLVVARMDGSLGFVHDQAFAALLAERGVRLEVDSRGSREVAMTVDPSRYDLASMGNALYKKSLSDRLGKRVTTLSQDSPFWSMLVVATTEPVARLLQQRQITWYADGVWSFDVASFMAATEQGLTWSAFTDNRTSTRANPNRVTVHMTDPTQSNSSAMLIMLMSSAANADPAGTLRAPQDAAEADRTLPRFRACVTNSGLKEDTTDSLVKLWVASPTGYPLALMYENDFVTAAERHPDRARQPGSPWVALYVTPRMLTRHVITSWTARGNRVLDAIGSPAGHRLLLRYGYREDSIGSAPGGAGFQARLGGRGIAVPQDAQEAIVPAPDAIERLIGAFPNSSVVPASQPAAR